MFSSSILFGNHVPLISLGTVISAVLEVRINGVINPIFDSSLTELDSEVSKQKQKRPLRHRTTQRDYGYSRIITRHAAEPWHD